MTAPRNCILIFGAGAICGFSFTYLFLSLLMRRNNDVFFQMTWNNVTYHAQRPQIISSNSSVSFHMRGVSDRFARQDRILCWVMTGPAFHEFKAKHVKETWGRRCTILLFMSSEKDPSLPTIALNVSEGRNYLWEKTKQAFAYVYKNHFHDADWFMKADDDTYVIIENLRHMLRSYDADEPIYFGCRFRHFVKQGFMSGGPGYVLSREALRRFVEEGLPDNHKCRQGHSGYEDVEMGICLEKVGVKAIDTRDEKDRLRFLPLYLERHLVPGGEPNYSWYWDHIYHPSKEGLDCCSDMAISFHYVDLQVMYVMEYLLYSFFPYGIKKRLETKTLPSTTSLNPLSLK